MKIVGASSEESSNPDRTQTQTDESSRLLELQLAASVLAKDRKATAEFVALYADSINAYVRRRLIPRMNLVDDVGKTEKARALVDGLVRLCAD